MIDNELYQRILKYEKRFKLNKVRLIKMLEWAEIEFDKRKFNIENIGVNEYFVARRR